MRPSRSKPEVDHDACGVGFIAQLGSSGSRDVVERALPRWSAFVIAAALTPMD
jgi:hypothetical protein